MIGYNETDFGPAPLRRRIFGSALSALVGWLTLTCVLVVGTIFEGLLRVRASPYEWEGCVIMSVVGFGFVFVTWLIVLVPLYLCVPARSPLWHWCICTLSGACAGAFIMSAFFGFGTRESGIAPTVILAAITGGATCLFGSLTASRFQRAHRGSEGG